MDQPLTEKPNAEVLPALATVGTVLDGCYLAPPEDKDGKIWVRTSARIEASSEKLYELWRNVEKAPLWQEQITSVRGTGTSTSHWVMGSGNKAIEWDSEILADQPGRRIAWRSIGGDSDNAGEVVFESAPAGHGTLVTVLQQFRMGKLASAWKSLVGRNPKQTVIQNLRHFKALAETGEIPRTEGQPHGPRGAIANLKESVYGEKIEPPPGLDSQAS